MVQDAACKKINNVLVDTSDLAISQYSLLGPSPPLSAPDSPSALCRDSSPAVEDHTQPEEALVQQLHVLDAQHEANGRETPRQETTSLGPSIVATEQLNGSPSLEGTTSEEVHLHTDTHTSTAESEDKQVDHDPPQALPDPEGPEPSAAPQPASSSDVLVDKPSSEQQPSADSLVNIRLGLLSRAVAAPPGPPEQRQVLTDRAVYLSGHMKNNWEVEKLEELETSMEEAKGAEGGEEETGELAEGGGTEENLNKCAEEKHQDSDTEEEVKMEEKKEVDNRERGGECKKKKEEEQKKEKEDDHRKRGEKDEEVQEVDQVKEKEEEQKKETEEEQMEIGGQKGEKNEEKNDKRGVGKTHEEQEKEQKEKEKKKEEEQENGGRQGKNAEEAEQKVEKVENDDRGRERQEEEEEQEKVVPEGPLVELQPDAIAAIRELVSEVIEVQVDVSPAPDLPRGPPPSWNKISPSPPSQL